MFNLFESDVAMLLPFPSFVALVALAALPVMFALIALLKVAVPLKTTEPLKVFVPENVLFPANKANALVNVENGSNPFFFVLFPSRYKTV